MATTSSNSDAAVGGETPFPLPRVTIKFCTQCKWMLRAAYYAQELLSTFSTSLGEVALQPSTGGTFVVQITTHQEETPLPPPSSPPPSSSSAATTTTTQIWDRKTDGGFPETKELKRRVRDIIEPGRNLGHVDRDHPRPGGADLPNTTTATTATTTGTGTSSEPAQGGTATAPTAGREQQTQECEDCK